MRIFLTGISGGLGSLLAERIAPLPEVECVTGIDVTEPKKPLPARANFVKMDIRSPYLAAAMAGHDTVIHTAFLMLWPAKMQAAMRDDINVNGVRNVALAAVANHVRTFIHASSTAAYDPLLVARKTAVAENFPLGRGDSPFYYSANKAAGERVLTKVLEGSGIRLTIFRPHAFAGPSSKGTLEILRGTGAQLPGRDPRGQITHEDDVVAAFLQALRTDMLGAYNIAPDDFIRMSDGWKIIGARAPIVPSHLMQLFLKVRWQYLGSPIHPSWVEARMSDFTVSNVKLKSTGWKPRYGTVEALRAAV